MLLSTRTPRARHLAIVRISLALASVALLALAIQPALAAAPKPGPWIGLAGGKVGKYEWTVRAHRPGGAAGAGPRGPQRPCLWVGASLKIGRYSYRRSKYQDCAGRGEHLKAGGPPLLATATPPSTGASVEITAVGMMFAPGARRVRITLSDGTTATVRLGQLSAKQAHEARLARVRYAAFVVRGVWCAERMVSLDAQGRTLWDSGTDTNACNLDAFTSLGLGG
jgi:hypothetical protein